MKSLAKIAILATGDELVFGEILNTNGQKIAQTLMEEGFLIGMHMVVSDAEDDIVSAINYLKKNHQVIITIGGLGPTSDDRTRFALANSLKKKLIFDETSWAWICERLSRYKMVANPSNQQQAYFPEGAQILHNANGTANGCAIQSNDVYYYMLPGPPQECLPIFKEQVLPDIKKYVVTAKLYHARWRLFGVAESEIAAKLDKLTAHFVCETGYRWHYPYIDFKIKTSASEQLPEIIACVDDAVKPYVICPADLTASEKFFHDIENSQCPIHIEDHATKGFIQSQFSTPHLLNKILFSPLSHAKTDTLHVKISGLEAFWTSNEIFGLTEVEIVVTHNGKTSNFQREFPFRNRSVLLYVYEWLCWILTSALAK